MDFEIVGEIVFIGRLSSAKGDLWYLHKIKRFCEGKRYGTFIARTRFDTLAQPAYLLRY